MSVIVPQETNSPHFLTVNIKEIDITGIDSFAIMKVPKTL